MVMNSRINNQKNILITLGLFLVVSMLACQATVAGRATDAPKVVLTEATVEEVSQATQPAVISLPSTSPVVGEHDDALIAIYARVNPAVVNVTTYQTENGLLVATTQGSGFVVDNNGSIVTNAHVVHGSEQVEITFSDGTARIAERLGEDLNSDLAVLKVDPLPEGVQPLAFGDMNSLAVGQTVIAIGNPFGLEGTLTRGVISALGRNIPALTPFSIPQSIQTDAAINPGNSGGPLLNLDGEVIGVNAQIETGGTGRSNLGVGFAIPVSILKVVIPDLIKNGSHDWAYLGVRGSNLNAILVKAMNLPVEKGAYLVEVLSDGPSAQANLRGANETVTVDGRQVEIGGDVVTAVDGQALRSFDDLLIYIAVNASPGQTIRLTILRDGKQQEVDVVLAKRPASTDNVIVP
jgi:S1-C subfamily serine protease